MMRFYKLVPEWQTLVQSEDGEWVARIDASSMMRELERDRLAIESLTEENERLRSAISRLAKEADNYEPDSGDGDEEAFATQIFIGELREMRRLVRGA